MAVDDQLMAARVRFLRSETRRIARLRHGSTDLDQRRLGDLGRSLVRELLTIVHCAAALDPWVLGLSPAEFHIATAAPRFAAGSIALDGVPCSHAVAVRRSRHLANELAQHHGIDKDRARALVLAGVMRFIRPSPDQRWALPAGLPDVLARDLVAFANRSSAQRGRRERTRRAALHHRLPEPYTSAPRAHDNAP